MVLFQQSAAEAAGLGATDYRAINLLDLCGPQSPGALSATLGLTTGATTRLIDRLVAAGYARRSTDQHDRRKVTVTGIPERERLDSLLSPVEVGLMSHLTGLAVEQRAAVTEYLDAATRAYSQAVAALVRQRAERPA